MIEKDPVTGQLVDCQEGKDNSPPRYSAPSFEYKMVLKYHANSECTRCGGTGYIGKYKHIAGGRCFECLSDSVWEERLGEYVATGIDDDNKEVCEIRKVSNSIYTESGFVITSVGCPPYGDFKIYKDEKEASDEAMQIYNL